jgi:hypothetical protein
MHRHNRIYANSPSRAVDRDKELASYGPDAWRPAFVTVQDFDKSASPSWGVTPANDTGGMDIVDARFQPLGELVITLIAAEHPYERPRLALSLRLPGE